jgi:hypothetical protein
MLERRFQSRMLCADLVELCWTDPQGRLHSIAANLEDISQSGACLQTEVPVAPETQLQVRHTRGAFDCRVRYCVFREIGYFLGVEFAPDHLWSPGDFQPEHLLDLQELVMRTAEKASANSRTGAAID